MSHLRSMSHYDESSSRDESPSVALFGPIKSEGFVSLRRDSESGSDDSYNEIDQSDVDNVLEEFKCLDWADDPLDNTGESSLVIIEDQSRPIKTNQVISVIDEITAAVPGLKLKRSYGNL